MPLEYQMLWSKYLFLSEYRLCHQRFKLLFSLNDVDASSSEYISTHAFSPLFAVWQELAYYEENTRDFLFPEPRLTPSHPGMCREVLMKTVEGFPVSDQCLAGLLLWKRFLELECFITNRACLWADHFILVSAPLFSLAALMRCPVQVLNDADSHYWSEKWESCLTRLSHCCIHIIT